MPNLLESEEKIIFRLYEHVKPCKAETLIVVENLRKNLFGQLLNLTNFYAVIINNVYFCSRDFVKVCFSHLTVLGAMEMSYDHSCFTLENKQLNRFKMLT